MTPPRGGTPSVCSAKKLVAALAAITELASRGGITTADDSRQFAKIKRKALQAGREAATHLSMLTSENNEAEEACNALKADIRPRFKGQEVVLETEGEAAMATKIASKSVVTDEAWTIETTAIFGARLNEMAAVLTMLISNVSEYSKDGGHATDEALVLANQLLLSTCVELEKLSYEYTISPQVSVGNLSLYLMWARSLLEITDEMFHTDSWEINVADQTLAGYFGAVKRQVDRAYHEASNMQFQEVA